MLSVRIMNFTRLLILQNECILELRHFTDFSLCQLCSWSVVKINDNPIPDKTLKWYWLCSKRGNLKWYNILTWGRRCRPKKSLNALLYVKSDITKVKLITMKHNKYAETETERSDKFLLGRLFADRTVSTETVISSVFSFAKSGKFNSDARTY